jgi:hypothetical protein
MAEKMTEKHDLRDGDLVVLAGGTGSGRSGVARTLAAEFAEDRHVTHFDLERTAEEWSREMEAFPDSVRGRVSYSNVAPDVLTPFDLRDDVVIVDSLELACRREMIEEFARGAKRFAVRMKTKVVLVSQLPRDVARRLTIEGHVDLWEFPDWMNAMADHVFIFRPDPEAVETVRYIHARGREASGLVYRRRARP